MISEILNTYLSLYLSLSLSISLSLYIYIYIYFLFVLKKGKCLIDAVEIIFALWRHSKINVFPFQNFDYKVKYLKYKPNGRPRNFFLQTCW